MPITVGIDTYVTVAQADIEAARWPRLAGWAALPEATKEAALIEAENYLSRSYKWKGQLADHSQFLSWPRIGVKDHENREVNGIPPAVITAQVSLAYEVASNAPLVTNRDTGEVESIKAGEVSIKFVKGQNAREGERFASIDRILLGLFISRAGSITGNFSLIRS